MIYKNSQNIKNIFNKVSSRYDFFNNLFSLGLHNFWKRKLVKFLKPQEGEFWADLCCGTGDMAILISKKIIPRGKVIGFDNAYEILKVAKKKSKKISNHVISWENKDVFDIDSSICNFDGVCMSYGLRNLSDTKRGITKVFSILKENGRAGFLDFNHSEENSFSAYFQKMYLKLIVVPISGFFNLKSEYEYIEKSIAKFPNGDNLIKIAKDVGFREVKYKTVLGGQMGFLILRK